MDSDSIEREMWKSLNLYGIYQEANSKSDGFLVASNPVTKAQFSVRWIVFNWQTCDDIQRVKQMHSPNLVEIKAEIQFMVFGEPYLALVQERLTHSVWTEIEYLLQYNTQNQLTDVVRYGKGLISVIAQLQRSKLSYAVDPYTIFLIKERSKPNRIKMICPTYLPAQTFAGTSDHLKLAQMLSDLAGVPIYSEFQSSDLDELNALYRGLHLHKSFEELAREYPLGLHESSALYRGPPYEQVRSQAGTARNEEDTGSQVEASALPLNAAQSRSYTEEPKLSKEDSIQRVSLQSKRDKGGRNDSCYLFCSSDKSKCSLL